MADDKNHTPAFKTDAGGWRVRNPEIVYKAFMWDVERSYRQPATEDPIAGEWFDFYRMIDADFVHIIALVDDPNELSSTGAEQRVVLAAEYHPGIGQRMLALPGGGVDEGESFQDAAIRELREETGYEATTWTDLGEFYPSPKRQNNKGRVFLAQGCTLTGETKHDATEDITLEYVGVRELRQRVLSGEMNNGFIMACLYLWEAHKAAEKGNSS